MTQPAGPPRLPALTRSQVWLLLATLACYAVGYPVAMIGNSGWGWVLVTLGGVLLLALGVITVNRIYRSGLGKG